MHLRFLRVHVALWTILLASSTAFATSDASSIRHRRNWSTFSNRTVLLPEDPVELQKRDGSKYVFMHHIVGNTYPYTYADWLDDMVKISAKGIDAIALNIGSSDWQRTQVSTAYQAAKDSGTGIKLFYSFDLTEMPCDLGDLVARVNLYASHPNQFKVNGKVMISSYSGDCLGQSGWASLKAQTNGYLMPFIWGLEGQFNQWSALDSWYCWGCAWPQGNYPKNTDDDNYYISQLGTKYATTISGWMYTHLSSKNFYLRGDDWLIVSRWEQLMQMRNTLTFVEMVTWNDWGESDYFGPFKGAQPTGTFYAQDYPHTAWFDLSEYYIKAFQTGSYPAITSSKIYFWARPHPAGASASGDSLGKPTGWDWTEDSMWAAVYSTASATVILKCGSSSSSFSVGAGVSKLKIPLAAGKMTVQMIRNGQTIINYTPTDYTYVTNPVQYNYNAWVGSAVATSEGTSTTTSTTTTASSSTTTSSTTSSTSTTTSSTSTTSTTTSTTSSAISTPTSGWSYQGCYTDSETRTLTGLYVSDSAQTVEKCQARCQAGGYLYAGVEYGVECFCSNTILSTASKVAESDCSMTCGGNSGEKCGAGYRLSLYKAASVAPVSWSNYGCVAEGTTGTRRALTGASYDQSNMTPATCQTLCLGYTYAGVEAGHQCFCGNSLTNNGASGAIAASSNCQTNCIGDSSQKCGGSWYLGVFKASTGSASTTSSTTTATTTTSTSTSSTSSTTTTTTSSGATSTPTSWSAYGCVAEGTTGTRRALTGASFTQSNMTPTICQSLCLGYTYAGVEYGQECYCGNSLTNNGATGSVISTSNCQTPCAGDSSKMCGGGWTMNVYTKPAASISGWTSAGCYVDSSSRMLRGTSNLSQAGLTTEMCINICAQGGFTMAGTEDGNQCFCGSQIYKDGGSGVSTASGECSSPCNGNSAQTCGGGWRINLYLKSSSPV
ncbi:hypothetical protein BDN70DRAFT_181683 [Pholiota conissans]|uniref:WSC domain-containing protein n=1 Tax=Pholiota conissans TaxID=109636 RepID=A0A9P5Z9Y1_9AGAR|nr:hypothetical protein BDN70DRAFT_181683 [Pholiota conissans]